MTVDRLTDAGHDFLQMMFGYGLDGAAAGEMGERPDDEREGQHQRNVWYREDLSQREIGAAGSSLHVLVACRARRRCSSGLRPDDEFSHARADELERSRKVAIMRRIGILANACVARVTRTVSQPPRGACGQTDSRWIAASMSVIFISYRRDDSQGFAGRLEDDLSECFGEERVFRDREIPVGTDFAQHLEGTLGAAAVLLAVIGPNWLEVRGADGRRRLDDPGTGCAGKSRPDSPGASRWSPCWSAGPGCPGSGAAACAAPLAGRQAFVLSDRRWREELKELAGELARLSPKLSGRGEIQMPRSGRIDALEVLRDVLARRKVAPPQGLAARVGSWLLPSAAAAAGAGGRACDRRGAGQSRWRSARQSHRRQCRRHDRRDTQRPWWLKPALSCGAVQCG